MLACYVSQKVWDKYLPKLAFAYNTAVHHTTGLTPFEVIYGRKPKLPVDMLFPAPDLDLNLDLLSYSSIVRADILRCYETVAQNADVKVSKFKFYADRNVRPFGYALGDRVYLLKQAERVKETES
ncbi:Transposon Ty3-G Gag-Pol poly [Brachionus plicatilis]|uniref:Transposon Ty3-G Gag-Pol poly n=1 Tax=Brachionus plicatilis TaxID=10195 RepID=A0A3M7QPV3_BRAPC|nr:Transposon Ty3-G Gag-Pol poly [Brachionus plicatilis]